jgi:hypothetical protein
MYSTCDAHATFYCCQLSAFVNVELIVARPNLNKIEIATTADSIRNSYRINNVPIKPNQAALMLTLFESGQSASNPGTTVWISRVACFVAGTNSLA